MTPEEEALLVLQGHWIEIDVDRAGDLLPLAEDGSGWAHDAICAVADRLTAAGQTLPIDIQRYVVDRAKGSFRRKRGGDKHANFARNICIVVAIKRLQRRGISPTRNEATKRESGCSIVSAALVRIGVTMPEATVAKVWEQHLRDERADLH